MDKLDELSKKLSDVLTNYDNLENVGFDELSSKWKELDEIKKQSNSVVEDLLIGITRGKEGKFISKNNIEFDISEIATLTTLANEITDKAYAEISRINAEERNKKNLFFEKGKRKIEISSITKTNNAMINNLEAEIKSIKVRLGDTGVTEEMRAELAARGIAVPTAKNNLSPEITYYLEKELESKESSLVEFKSANEMYKIEAAKLDEEMGILKNGGVLPTNEINLEEENKEKSKEEEKKPELKPTPEKAGEEKEADKDATDEFAAIPGLDDDSKYFLPDEEDKKLPEVPVEEADEKLPEVPAEDGKLPESPDDTEEKDSTVLPVGTIPVKGKDIDGLPDAPAEDEDLSLVPEDEDKSKADTDTGIESESEEEDKDKSEKAADKVKEATRATSSEAEPSLLRKIVNVLAVAGAFLTGFIVGEKVEANSAKQNTVLEYNNDITINFKDGNTTPEPTPETTAPTETTPTPGQTDVDNEPQQDKGEGGESTNVGPGETVYSEETGMEITNDGSAVLHVNGGSFEQTDRDLEHTSDGIGIVEESDFTPDTQTTTPAEQTPATTGQEQSQEQARETMSTGEQENLDSAISEFDWASAFEDAQSEGLSK